MNLAGDGRPTCSQGSLGPAPVLCLWTWQPTAWLTAFSALVRDAHAHTPSPQTLGIGLGVGRGSVRRKVEGECTALRGTNPRPWVYILTNSVFNAGFAEGFETWFLQLLPLKFWTFWAWHPLTLSLAEHFIPQGTSLTVSFFSYLRQLPLVSVNHQVTRMGYFFVYTDVGMLICREWSQSRSSVFGMYFSPFLRLTFTAAGFQKTCCYLKDFFSLCETCIKQGQENCHFEENSPCPPWSLASTVMEATRRHF